jgi:hypothetical protein
MRTAQVSNRAEKAGRKGTSLLIWLAAGLTLVLVVVGCTPDDSEHVGADPEDDRGEPASSEGSDDESDPIESNPPSDERQVGGDPTFEREVHPDEWAETLVTCVQEEGFPARVTRDRGVAYGEVGSDQAPHLEAAVDTCMERFPIEARFTGGMSEEGQAILYRYYVEEAIPCLEAEGFDGFDPPSEGTFVATYGTDDHWSPFQRIPPGSGDEEHELREKCPPAPPIDELFPEE